MTLFRTKARTRRQRTISFVALSLAIHIVFLLAFLKPMARYAENAANTHEESILIELEPRDSKPIKQIAETTLVKKSDKVAPDAFLGQQTQTVDRQTKANKVATFHDGRVGSAHPQSQSGDKAKDLKLGQIGVPMDFKPLGNIEPQSVTSENASTSDYLKDVKDGAQTLLNTKEFAFFSFYQRVRKQLEQFWEPGLRAQIKKLLDRGRHIAENREHTTHLLVVLNAEGTITRIQVIDTSGYVDLDQAAISAFNRAGPFPNPPKGMVERDGTVKVEWEFVLKT